MKNITIKNISLIVLSAVTTVFFCFGCKNSVDAQDFSSAVNKAQKKEKQPQQGNQSANPGQGQTPPANTYKITKATPIGAGNQFAYFNIKIEPENVLTQIDMVMFGNKNGIKENSKYQTWGKDLSFFVDTGTDKTVYIKEPQDGQKISFKDKTGAVLGAFIYQAKPAAFKKCEDPQTALPQAHGSVLKVRLKGSFEAAIVGQQKYDGMAGASGSLSLHKNSNAQVQIAEKENPTEADWADISTSDLSFKKSRVKIEPEGSGMSGMFITRFGAVSLSGVPRAAGNFKISVELQDNLGRKAVSNPLFFNVYDLEKTTLEERLKEVTQEAWDMEPWNIVKFGGSNNTVTVPKTLKRWFGSHTSGTYGFLGYAVANGAKTTQTLIVGEGSNLKLINMQTLSSVNIIVKKGAVLNLQDSSIHGTITVENGGTFQMNYDSFNKQFTTGAQINGQLILKEGAVLDNSLIYSNSNYLANGKAARRNEEPVITAEGNVTVIGKVYVRGDEAPTGTSPKTGRSFAGQPAMSVKNGSLTIKAGAELGLYGGGRTALTTNGGDALLLSNGTIHGEGRLIAVAGNSSMLSGNGGNAVLGTGILDIKEAFLQGGNVYTDKSVPGKPYTTGITITDKPVGQAIYGKVLHGVNDDDNAAYWKDILKPPAGPYNTAGKPQIKKQ